MKTTMTKMKTLFMYSVLISMLSIAIGCNDDDVPPLENEEEVIDLVRVTFSAEGKTPVVFTASDADGEGPEEFTIQRITLESNTTYTLSIEIENTVVGEDITEEVDEEGEEHLFLFAWNEGAFTSPSGDGNIDNRTDPINYNDEDASGEPLGLSTTWTTGDAASGGYFRTVLKHQPDIKSSTSGFQDGETDIDLIWDLVIL